MAVVIGTAMEHIAKATSSTAHIYKNLELGQQTGQVKLACNSYDPMFADVIRATGSVSTVGQEESKAAAPSQARGEESKAPAREESKTPAQAKAPAQS